MRWSVILVSLALFAGCRSESPDASVLASQRAAISKGEVEIQPGVIVADAHIARAFDGLTAVRLRLINRTGAAVQWSSLRDVDVGLARPAGRALLTANSPGRVKPIVVPAGSEARITLLFEADALDGTALTLFGRAIALARS